MYRAHVGQLQDGAVLEFAIRYQRISRELPRHNH
jgi:hypothetical protein